MHCLQLQQHFPCGAALSPVVLGETSNDVDGSDALPSVMGDTASSKLHLEDADLVLEHEQPHLDQKKMLMEAMISGDMASKGLMRPMDREEEEAADSIFDEKQAHCFVPESLCHFSI